MLSSDSTLPSPCDRAEALRDYAFDELPGDERGTMEQHLESCEACAWELDRLRLTTAALRTLPEREVPQRIAFVSDRVFEPSAFRRFWNSGARTGFASACVLAGAMVLSAWHLGRPVEVRTVVRTASASTEQIDAAVAKAVAQVRESDARIIQAAVETSERKRAAEYSSQMVAIGENFERLQKKLNQSYATLASNDLTGSGAGQ